jgi:hypothetical protein
LSSGHDLIGSSSPPAGGSPVRVVARKHGSRNAGGGHRWHARRARAATAGSRAPPGRCLTWSDPVPPEYSIVGLTCCSGCRPDAVMVGWPGASEDLLPADALVIRAACTGVPRRPGEGRRVAGGAPRGAVCSGWRWKTFVSLPSQRWGEAGGSLIRGSAGKAGAASTKSRRSRTAGWGGRGEQDGKVYARNRCCYAS